MMNPQPNKVDITKTDLVGFREYMPSDKAFILATWLRALRFGNSWYNLIDAKVYYAVYHAVLENLLAKSTTTIRVACLKDDPEVILGFSVYESPRLHWVYIKQAWRKLGIARALVPKEITVVSHLTEPGKAIMLKKKLIFNPFLLT